MRTQRALLVSAAISSLSWGMSGLSVTATEMKQTYSGTQSITAYTITGDQVSGSRVIDSFTNTSDEWGHYYTPSISPGGTFVVYVRSYESRSPTRHTDWYVTLASTDGSVRKDICQLRAGCSNLWWLHDGTIVYYRDDCYLRKLTMEKSGNAVTVYESIIGAFDHLPQYSYFDLSMDGAQIAFRIYRGACFGASLVSTQTMGPVPADTSTHISSELPGFWNPLGCGNAVAPLGEYCAVFQGSGHEVLTFLDATTKSVVFTFNNRDSLKAWSGEQFADTVYPGGTEDGQGWAVNSNDWSTASLGFPVRSALQGSEQILVNWRQRKCIDVTKHCILGSATRAWARRGDLWVSTQADVIPALWQYVQNRDAERTAWNAMAAALPTTAQFPDSVGTPSGAGSGWSVAALPGELPVVRTCPGGIVIDLRAPVIARLRVWTLNGALERSAAVSGCAGPTVLRLARGAYVVDIEAGPAGRRRALTAVR